MIDTTQFRKDFPAFADTTAYTEAAIRLWLSVAVNMVNEDRWGALYNLGLELVVAHHLVLAARDEALAAAGAVPGAVQGVVASKAVDKVSVSYDAASVTNSGDGFWNMTSYGIRFRSLAKQFGAGGLQLGGC